MANASKLCAAAALALGLAGCSPNAAYRAHVGLCPVTAADCGTWSLVEHPVPQHPDKSYLSAFVEFDDQGRPYDRGQIDALFGRLEDAAKTTDLSIIVFVHGWKHNASADDPNVMEFEKFLGKIADMEEERPPGAWWKPRRVLGIYLGWRGLSLDLGEAGRDLTFWARKDAAHRVAEGSIREVLARVKAVRDTVDATSWPNGGARNTRLITIGHSFGGLIVYAALAQYLTEKAAASATSPLSEWLAASGGKKPASDENARELAGYGDLVIVVNPAIEAMRYEPIRELVAGRKRRDYATNQNPVFIEVTSDADWATGIVFPIGRFANTVLEHFTDDRERGEARTAFGHYAPFWTHRLAGPVPVADPNATLPRVDVEAECKEFSVFNAESRPNGFLRPGWQRRYRTGATLTHLTDTGYDPNNPFWVVVTDKSMIRDHNDIEEPVFTDFVRQLYDDLVRLKEKEPCLP